jgi:hypothetical protein
MPQINDKQWEKLLAGYFDYLAAKENGSSSSGAPEAESAFSAPAFSDKFLLPVKINPPVTRFEPVKIDPVFTVIPRNRFEVPPVKNQFQIRPLPFVVLEPPPEAHNPVRSGDFLLWPDPPRDRAFFALAVPRLTDFSLTVQREVQSNGSHAITGATAVMTLSVYSPESPAALERYRQEWTARLASSGFPARNWKFLPVSLSNLQASLNLSAVEKQGEPRVSTSPGAGTATAFIELSPSGALAWSEALTRRSASSIAGVCNLRVSYCVQANNRVELREHNLTANLGVLLGACGPEKVTIVNPQQTIVAKIIVDDDELLDRVIVNMRPNMNLAPQSQTFSATGGEIAMNVTTSTPNQVRIDWSADWSFKPPDWPVIREIGALTASTGTQEIIKPSSWLFKYRLIAMFVGEDGKSLANPSSNDYRVQGTFTYTARYLPTGLLSSVFECGHMQQVPIVLPKFPQQSPGDLILFLSAMVKGKGSVITKKLQLDNPFVIAKIFPDAKIELVTANDPVSELSEESELLNLLATLE